jgi:hypothetical protein
MIRKIASILTGLFLAGSSDAQIFSQLYSGRQEIFLEAESYLLFEEYNEALPLYLELLKDQPANHFLSYRTGVCYLNIPGKKEMAIGFLEKAITDIDMRDRRPTYRTTRAPLDALFYLGNAYHINYQFEKALEMYSLFRDRLNLSIYSLEVVEDNMQASRNAIQMTGRPEFFIKENLGQRINSGFSELNPVVSGNGSVLVFNRKLRFYTGMFFSEWSDQEQKWAWPVEITPQIGVDGDYYPVSLSWDGKELFTSKSDDLIGNIYSSRFIDGNWTGVNKLNGNINTRHWESHASISGDGRTLYFTSNRPGGTGGLDIYYSKRDNGGDWGPAVNLGKTINTAYNEETPFISADGKTLYFSSQGHKNMGGYDIFHSKLQDNGVWSPPVNAGYGINTPDDDLFYHPFKNGTFAYVSRYSTDGFGEMDIFRYEFFSETNPRKFLISGIMGRLDRTTAGPGARISVLNRLTGDTLINVIPRTPSGQYALSLEPGNWNLVFSEEGYDDIELPLELRADRVDSEIRINAMLSETGLEYRAMTLETSVPDLPGELQLPEITEGDYQLAEFDDTPVQAEVPSEPREEEAPVPLAENMEAGSSEDYSHARDQVEEDVREVLGKDRSTHIWWILILALLLLAAFYYKNHITRNKYKS